jgi:hypothetical protein
LVVVLKAGGSLEEPGNDLFLRLAGDRVTREHADYWLVDCGAYLLASFNRTARRDLRAACQHNGKSENAEA